MPGMGTGGAGPAVVAAFRAAQLRQGLVALVIVAALTAAAAGFLSGRLLRPVLLGFTVLCLADWVLVQDLGFLGGVGTDPNSVISLIPLAAAGYLALVQAPAREVATAADAPPYVRKISNSSERSGVLPGPVSGLARLAAAFQERAAAPETARRVGGGRGRPGPCPYAIIHTATTAASRPACRTRWPGPSPLNHLLGLPEP